MDKDKVISTLHRVPNYRVIIRPYDWPKFITSFKYFRQNKTWRDYEYTLLPNPPGKYKFRGQRVYQVSYQGEKIGEIIFYQIGVVIEVKLYTTSGIESNTQSPAFFEFASYFFWWLNKRWGVVIPEQIAFANKISGESGESPQYYKTKKIPHVRQWKSAPFGHTERTQREWGGFFNEVRALVAMEKGELAWDNGSNFMLPFNVDFQEFVLAHSYLLSEYNKLTVKAKQEAELYEKGLLA